MHADCRPPRSGLVLPLVLVLLAAGLCAEGQKRRKGKVPKATTEQDGKFTRINLESEGIGFLYVPKGLPKSEEDVGSGVDRPGLLVMLHGDGATAKGIMRTRLADAHGDYMLAVRGRNPHPENPQGFRWDTAKGVDDINDLVNWVLANHPVDPKKVVMIGHSAGGTLVLETYPNAPKLYQGLITVAAPRTPTSAHKKARVVVFLGSNDQNFSGADAVRNALGGKHRWKHGCLVIMHGAEHNQLPSTAHFALAIDWCLAEKAWGGEAEMPYRQQLTVERKPYRLIQIGYKGAENWTDRRESKRTKAKAKKLAASIARNCAKGKAYFPYEVLLHSDHEATYLQGGFLSLQALEAIDPRLAEAAKKLKPRQVSPIVEHAKGFLLVWRGPEGKG